VSILSSTGVGVDSSQVVQTVETFENVETVEVVEIVEVVNSAYSSQEIVPIVNGKR
jgi:hypothetical protein